MVCTLTCTRESQPYICGIGVVTCATHRSLSVAARMDRGASSEALFNAVCANDVNKASAALKKGADVNVVGQEEVRID